MYYGINKCKPTEHFQQYTRRHNRDIGTRTYMPLDPAISRDWNVIKRQAEKTLQYKDLATEIQYMWNVETKVMLVTT